MSSFNNSSRKFEQNNFNQSSSAMENHNGNGENGHTHDEFEDDGEGEFVVISKKHHQRGTKFRMRSRAGGSGGGGYHNHNHNNSYRIPLTSYPYHPSNIRRTQMMLEQQNNAKNNNVNGDASSTATTETNSSTNDSSNAKNSLPSSSSGTSTLSTASGPASDASSSTTGDVNVNELQPELDAIPKPKFIEAPVPTVNPWKVFNAAAVLSKKVKPPTGVVSGVQSQPIKPSTSASTPGPEPMTNGVSSHTNAAATITNKANGTSEKTAAPAKVIPATNAPPKTWAAISSEKTTKPLYNKPPAQTATRQHNDSKPIMTIAHAISDSVTRTTTSYSAQSSATAPAPWVSGRVLKLQQSSPNYTEKLKPTEWPSLTEVSKNVATIELKDEDPKKEAGETIAEEKAAEAEEKPAEKTSEKKEVDSKVTYKQFKVATTQTYTIPTISTSTQTQKQMDSKESHPTTASSPTATKAEHSDGESRGRGRSRGRGSSRAGSRGGRPHSASGQYKDPSSFAASTVPSRTEYTDYPPEYTTLIPPFSTVPDFIMPYVAPTTCRVAPIMSPDLAVPWVLASPAPPPRATLVDLVRKQIEYYFSQENLEKDFYLRRKMDAEGYLPIRLIASFQRVQSMTTDCTIVTDAIQASAKLEIRQATASVRTKHDPTKWPIDDGGNTQARNGEDSTSTKVPLPNY